MFLSKKLIVLTLPAKDDPLSRNDDGLGEAWIAKKKIQPEDEYSYLMIKSNHQKTTVPSLEIVGNSLSPELPTPKMQGWWAIWGGKL